jgi:GrpB-like predicted nucleotidyltransferase (UPF0157 family)
MEWNRLYELEVKRLQSITGVHFLDFEHIGSTAIEGMPAKPIIDLLVIVENVEAARDILPILEENGYEYRPNDDAQGRLFFAKGPRTNRTHYLSLTERDSDFYEEKIVFRDYLREYTDVADEYANLKRELANEYPDNRDRYTTEKGEFVENVLKRAMDDE